MKSTSSRKADHVQLCLNENVEYDLSSGFNQYRFIHCALPEIDFQDIHLKTTFFNYSIDYPMYISGMTGGYDGAIAINTQLAELCHDLNIPMVLGSQRSMLHNSEHDESFTTVRRHAPHIPISANIGATEIRDLSDLKQILRMCEIVDAQFLTVHCNPLQELMQPEGNTKFSKVIKGIEKLVKQLSIPVIIKEVGAGISDSVAKKLLDIGVQGIDIAGSGGTSWSGVEILRRKEIRDLSYFKNWGIPTARCLEMVSPLKQQYNFNLFSSGGIKSAHDIAMSIALGAQAVGSAKPILQAIHKGGTFEARKLIDELMLDLRRIMFLTGSISIESLGNAEYEKR